jgi:IS605 OrfB family transposase
MGRSLLIGALAGDGPQRVGQVLLGQRRVGGLDGQLDVGHVGMQQNPVSTNTRVLILSHGLGLLVGMRLRFRYRLDPTPAQRQALARAFGCARVVYNDGLRLREDAYKVGLPYVADARLLQQVTTAAKLREDRAWLGEVSAVVLQQSVADLNRAYRHYFRALAKARAAPAAGRTVRLEHYKPRYKSRRSGQSIRFTRNSCFRLLADGRLALPKIGHLKVRWSRPLPAEPSSVTVTLDGAARYHASFVVEVPETPLPVSKTAVGVDLGLSTFVALSDGRKEGNPRWLWQREKALRRSQRNLSRKQKGSKNSEKARRRVARLHLRVADARRDFHHQLSTRLIRENQTVCVEALNVAGLGRSSLAKSIHDAGWGQFTAMLAYKAKLYGRTIVKVDRRFPSSQRCSACGHRDGPKPLQVRTWTCRGCGVTHDRDVNAARNILAEGLSVAACGGGGRPGETPAAADEAGTTRGAAA